MNRVQCAAPPASQTTPFKNMFFRNTAMNVFRMGFLGRGAGGSIGKAEGGGALGRLQRMFWRVARGEVWSWGAKASPLSAVCRRDWSVLPERSLNQKQNRWTERRVGFRDRISNRTDYK